MYYVCEKCGKPCDIGDLRVKPTPRRSRIPGKYLILFAAGSRPKLLGPFSCNASRKKVLMRAGIKWCAYLLDVDGDRARIREPDNHKEKKDADTLPDQDTRH